MPEKITPEDLMRERRYRLLYELHYQEIPEFVMKYLFRKNRETRFFWFSVILFLLIAIKPTILFFVGGPGFLSTLWYLFLGFVGIPLLLIPLHEGIHALFFFFSGGRNIRVGVDLKNFFFYVTAHRYPVGRRAFTRIALAPFFVINTGLWAAAWFLSGGLSWSFYLALFSHATMCAGDFAMLSFYREQGEGEIITYDDVDEKTAYFYQKNEEEEG